MVYESMGEIWYTTTTGADNAWTQEVRLSDGSGNNKSPSIDATSGGFLVVVWQKDGTGAADIVMRRKSSGYWDLTETVAAFFTSSGFEATPVVAAAGWYYFFIWRDDDFNNLRIVSFDESEETFGAETSIANTNSNSLHPTLTADTYTKLHLAWQESGSIYYTKINHSSGGSYSWDVNKENVSSGTGYTSHVNPSITTDYSRRPNIIWQAYYPTVIEQEIIVHRRLETGGYWSSANSFVGNDDYFTPSITSFPNDPNNQNLRAGWQRGNYYLWKAQYNGSSWNAFYGGATGIDPNLSANPFSSQATKMVYRSVGSAPYALTTTSQSLSKSSPAEFTHHRRGIISSGDSEIIFELGNFSLLGSELKLFNYNDTLSVSHTAQWKDMFRTEPFRVTNQANLSYENKFGSLNLEALHSKLSNSSKLEFRLEAIDVQSGVLLATADILDVTPATLSNFSNSKNIVFNLAGTKEIYLRVNLMLPKDLNLKQSMVETYYIDDGQQQESKKIAANAIQVQLTPTEFILSPNYPNPFNPETTIKYQTDKNYPVSLKIFNLKGQEIRTLVNSEHQPGFYEVRWDGKNNLGSQVASGVYLYRIVAGENIATRKLTLLK